MSARFSFRLALVALLASILLGGCVYAGGAVWATYNAMQPCLKKCLSRTAILREHYDIAAIDQGMKGNAKYQTYTLEKGVVIKYIKGAYTYRVLIFVSKDNLMEVDFSGDQSIENNCFPCAMSNHDILEPVRTIINDMPLNDAQRRELQSSVSVETVRDTKGELFF